MGKPPVRIDVLMSIKGVDFHEAWDRKVISKFGDTKANFIALSDLICAKKAAGRGQDLVDLESLEKLNK